MGNACLSISGTLGTKTGAQCLESVTVMYILAKEDQKFANVQDFGTRSKWEALIASEEVAVLWELYEFANANSDAAFFESRNFKKQTSKATKVLEAEVFLSLCAHKMLKSYEDSAYTRLYEVTEDGFIIGVQTEGGGVKGQSLKDFNVGIRMNATTDKVPNTKITVTFADYEELERNPVMVDPSFNVVLDLEGVEQVKVMILDEPTPTSTSYQAVIETECAGGIVPELAETHLYQTDDTGAVAITSIAPVAGKPNTYAITTPDVAGIVSLRIGTESDTKYTIVNGDMYKSNTDTYKIT